MQEAPGGFDGGMAIEKMSIRFARSARRLQRAVKEGVKRICQIHLAYMGLDPDPNLFDVCMSETSTAEEQEVKDSLDTSLDVIEKMFSVFEKLDVGLDKVEMMNYFNRKFLKMNDFDLKKYITGDKVGTPGAEKEVGADLGAIAGNLADDINASPTEKMEINEAIQEFQEEVRYTKLRKGRKLITNIDLLANLPIQESRNGSIKTADEWTDTYSAAQVITEIKKIDSWG